MKLDGGCLCGAVTFEFTGKVVRTLYCHCKDCRRSGGSLFHFGVMIPRDGLTIHGQLARFEKTADDGNCIVRRFCSTCGSGIWNELEGLEDVVILKGGILTEVPEALRPDYEVYHSRKSHWIDTPDVTTSFLEGSGGAMLKIGDD